VENGVVAHIFYLEAELLESRQIIEARVGEEFRPPRFAFFCKKIWHKWFYQASVIL